MRFTSVIFLLGLTTAGCGDDTTAVADSGDTGGAGGVGAAGGGGTGGGVVRDPHLEVIAIDLTTDERGVASDILYDEPASVALSGFAPGDQVRVTMSGTGWESFAVFDIDDSGEANSSTDAPSDGTYEGVDQDGLFWSMLPTVEGADKFGLWELTFTAELEGQVVASHVMNRWFGVAGSQAIPVEGEAFVGTLHLPADAGPHPAVVLVGGSEGGSSFGDRMGPYYAARGYAALSLPYFGAPGLPTYLADIPLEYFESALAWLSNHASVDPTSIGVVGGSRGGELALLLGATFPTVRAVVASVPSGLIFSGLTAEGTETSSWTLDGQLVPYLPPVSIAPEVIQGPNGQPAYDFTEQFFASIDDASAGQLDAATTRVEQTQGPILIAAGADDRVWPSCVLSEFAIERLQQARHDVAMNDEFYCFEGTGHQIGLPGFPTTDVGFAYHPLLGGYLVTGGEPAATAKAQRAYRDAMLNFLNTHLAAPQ